VYLICVAENVFACSLFYLHVLRTTSRSRVISGKPPFCRPFLQYGDPRSISFDTFLKLHLKLYDLSRYFFSELFLFPHDQCYKIYCSITAASRGSFVWYFF
jgi:hypothetical protein